MAQFLCPACSRYQPGESRTSTGTCRMCRLAALQIERYGDAWDPTLLTCRLSATHSWKLEPGEITR